jgi:Rieske Fe-S protein
MKLQEAYLPPLDADKGVWDDHALSRAGFLQLGFWTVTSLAGLTLGGVGLRFLVGHSFTAPTGRWIELGKVSEMPPGKMHRVAYRFQTTDLWRHVEQRGIVYAFSQDGMNYLVLDATCSHLGCNVKWREAEGVFACPCHHGVYSMQGEVVSGPPPRPLRRLESVIRDGILLAFV